MPATDPTTIALTGQLPFILSTGAILALPLSYLLLRLYRRALLKGMNRSGEKTGRGRETARAEQAEAAPTPAGEFRLTVLDASSSAGREGAGPLLRRARSSPWRAGLVYGAGAAAFAAIMAFSFLRSSNTEFLPLRYLILFWVYTWPLVLTLSLVAATRRRTKLLLAAAHGVVFVALGAAVLARSPDSSIGQLAVLWLSTNLPPTLLLLVFLIRKVRAVGPLVVTFMVMALTGSNLLLSVLDRHQGLLRSVADVGFSLGLGGTAVFWALNLIGFLLFAVLGWFALQWVRRRYLAKGTNDQSLILDALWLLFGITYSIGLVFEGAIWILSGLAAFGAYKATVLAGFRMGVVDAPSRSARLLVLRVFSLGKRSEELFDAVTRHWRYLGDVRLISGPDLAATTVEPHEFLDFLSGRLDRQFIDGTEALEQRIKELDTRPDFDGRFRVNDFFCHDDTWQMTLGRLVGTSDMVLMDLRGFSPQNAGCAYELHELVNTAPLERVVIAMDATTDAGFLERTLRDAWAAMPPDSPNRSAKAEAHIVRLPPSAEQGLVALLELLCTAAESTDA
ncbi:hypothetical protein KI811_17730 [Geobacter hydrogenophilus]|uniref:Uncharacterized protein n=1 Tax=Geobacter hydrogenophilus TaxID=40983 RepID=A0A9W6FXW0_9BACT|nr:hypothetical protein [Geobacter hydrogenophilus]MBT0895649.1 hypothetical protein [Geobacter hydrogenophilus]GLI36803.1 hypothetical protein GHYDROH2_03040 [Geobacter hydrogenophilus]